LTGYTISSASREKSGIGGLRIVQYHIIGLITNRTESDAYR